MPTVLPSTQLSQRNFVLSYRLFSHTHHLNEDGRLFLSLAALRASLLSPSAFSHQSTVWKSVKIILIHIPIIISSRILQLYQYICDTMYNYNTCMLCECTSLTPNYCIFILLSTHSSDLGRHFLELLIYQFLLLDLV